MPPEKMTGKACDVASCTADREWQADAYRDPPDTLRKALGRPPADENGKRFGFVAHHIIPIDPISVGDYTQYWARWCRINPNSRANGVYLRGPARRSDRPGYKTLDFRTVVRPYFANARGAIYMTSVGRRLSSAAPEDGTCSASKRNRFLKQLASVKRSLINGTLRLSK